MPSRRIAVAILGALHVRLGALCLTCDEALYTEHGLPFLSFSPQQHLQSEETTAQVVLVPALVHDC